MAVLEKCCMACAEIQWLFHSSEEVIICGPLVSCFSEKIRFDISCESSARKDNSCHAQPHFL